MENLKSLIKKFCTREIMLYLVFGVLTTLVNLGVKYALLFTVFDASNGTQLQISIIISWVVACLFAYITNRTIVFKSESKNIFKEFVSFIGARLFTLGLEMLIMFVFVTLLKLDSNLWVIFWTLVSQVIVIVANYVFSKLFIFVKNKK